nr:hypothetical protein [Rhodococcus sp. BS-15]
MDLGRPKSTTGPLPRVIEIATASPVASRLGIMMPTTNTAEASDVTTSPSIRNPTRLSPSTNAAAGSPHR